LGAGVTAGCLVGIGRMRERSASDARLSKLEPRRGV
jgi:hypothetical protein